MITRGTWIHVNSMDLFIEILSITNETDDYIEFRYLNWNKGQCGMPHLISSVSLDGKILKSEYHNWKKYPALN